MKSWRLATFGATVASFTAASACQSSSFSGNPNKGATKAEHGSDATPEGATTGKTSGGTANPTGLGEPGKPGVTGQGTGGGTAGITGGGTGNTTSGVDSGVGSGKRDNNGLLVDSGGNACLPGVPSLNVMFAMDVTGSMDDEIDAIKSNVAQFAAALKALPLTGTDQKITNVQVGGVTYVDAAAEHHVINLTDPASFQTQVAGEGIRGGVHDHCEGGLGAAGVAMNMLAAAQDADNVLPVLIIVSDNYSHDETQPEGSRSFNSLPLQQAAANPILKNLLLFDSVPTTASVPTFTDCPGVDFSRPPSAQWEPIRAAWKAAHPTATMTPGGNIGFPFSASIMSQLPAELSKLIKICKP